MPFTPRDLMRLGLTAALLGSTSVAACGNENNTAPADSESSAVSGDQSEETSPASTSTEPAFAGEGEGGEGEGGEMGAMSTGELPIEKRLAFMRGHVEAGLALYRAGAPEQAAPHLLHPVSETHAAEREGLDDIGFKGDLFVGISDALEEGTASSEIEGQLSEAEENLAMMADTVGGDTADILNYLLDTTLAEYRIGVVDGEIVNAGEYQDAFGFVVVAQDYVGDLEGDAGEAVRTELEALQAMWPEAPLADSEPTPVDEIASQISRVQLELSAVR
ncbi:hypothetical protein [Henriciella aquimarina]|uniref:hypothetical protein n=1 Tax=Henriciella aquimarina TaxID=545261 RepID=UPI0009FF1A52|nr:hypothetical protein [Henriciella aquimarina]